MKLFSLQHLFIIIPVVLFAFGGVEPVTLVILYGVMLAVTLLQKLSNDADEIKRLLRDEEEI